VNFRENIRQGLDAVRSNLLRTVITCLIIAIGIGALVGILTAIEAMKGAITQSFSRMGTNSFNIRNRAGTANFGGRRQTLVEYKTITYTEARRFMREYRYPATVSVSTNLQFAATVKYANQQTNPNNRVQGVDEYYIETAGYSIETGRNFSETDAALGLPVAIIGKDVALQLFPRRNAIGEIIRIGNARLKVVGILQEKGSTLGMSGGDRIVFVPLTTGRNLLAKGSESYFINVSVGDIHQLDAAQDEAYLAFRRIRGLGLNMEDNFEITRSDAMAREAIDNLRSVSIAGTLIGIITLLGAAISLMNIMLVSVTERTREVGTRKALGATRSMIRNQFLTEAVVICQLGGLAGILLGLVIGNLISAAVQGGFIMPWNWIMLAVGVCTVVGLLSGLYPAIKASRLDPIEALRHE
jgi:putative ABC transport system permease protein